MSGATWNCINTGGFKMLYFLPKMLIQNQSYLSYSSYSLWLEWVTFPIEQILCQGKCYISIPPIFIHLYAAANKWSRIVLLKYACWNVWGYTIVNIHFFIGQLNWGWGNINPLIIRYLRKAAVSFPPAADLSFSDSSGSWEKDRANPGDPACPVGPADRTGI